MKTIRIITPLFVLLSTLANSAYCQELSLPPEAYQACEGKLAGEASQVIDPRGGTVSGICREVDGKLVLQPDRPKGDSAGTSSAPPPEAYQACEGKLAGEASQVTGPSGRTVSGTCKEVDGKLVLQPDRPKGNSAGTSSAPPPEAYQACEGKLAGEASQVIDPRGGTVSGICKDIAGKLILQPDRP